MSSVLLLCVLVCGPIELKQPPGRGPATVLGAADERLLVFRLGMWPNLRVNQALFDKIQPGMKESEIEKVLGTPTRTVDGVETVMHRTPTGCRGFDVVKRSDWAGLDQVVVIYFGKKRTVELKYLRPVAEWAEVDCLLDTRNDFEKIRDWLMP